MNGAATAPLMGTPYLVRARATIWPEGLAWLMLVVFLVGRVAKYTPRPMKVALPASTVRTACVTADGHLYPSNDMTCSLPSVPQSYFGLLGVADLLWKA